MADKLIVCSEECDSKTCQYKYPFIIKHLQREGTRVRCRKTDFDFHTSDNEAYAVYVGEWFCHHAAPFVYFKELT